MTKTELVSAVAKKTGYADKVVHEVITSTVDTIMKQVSKNDSVQLIGFGTFSKRKRAARKYAGIDGETHKARATSIPYFTAGETFKKKVRGKK